MHFSFLPQCYNNSHLDEYFESILALKKLVGMKSFKFGKRHFCLLVFFFPPPPPTLFTDMLTDYEMLDMCI